MQKDMNDYIYSSWVSFIPKFFENKEENSNTTL